MEEKEFIDIVSQNKVMPTSFFSNGEKSEEDFEIYFDPNLGTLSEQISKAKFKFKFDESVIESLDNDIKAFQRLMLNDYVKGYQAYLIGEKLIIKISRHLSDAWYGTASEYDTHIACQKKGKKHCPRITWSGQRGRWALKHTKARLRKIEGKKKIKKQ